MNFFFPKRNNSQALCPRTKTLAPKQQRNKTWRYVGKRRTYFKETPKEGTGRHAMH